MEITKKQAINGVRAGTMREIGTVIYDGWRWMALDNILEQRTDHYRIERVLE